jgi:hypothetical protein
MTVINYNFNIPTFFFDLLIIDLKQYIKEIIGDGVTSALRMMCVDMLWAVAFSDEYT